MAGRPREPVDLIKAKGKKHLSQKEYDERKAGELQVPFVDVEPPSYLTATQKKKFTEIAELLLPLGIFTELDVDALGRYVISRELYLEFTKQLKKKLQDSDTDIREITATQAAQDKAFRQCVTSANELCLNVSSRAKLVIPQTTDGEDDEL